VNVTKPHLACDWEPGKVRFPVAMQPKLDGVRGVNLHGRMTARTLKPFKNKHTGLFFSQAAFLGLDGELAAEHEAHPRLCSLTSSATGTIEGTPWLMWHVFDYLRPEFAGMPYKRRYAFLDQLVERIKMEQPVLGAHLTLMPMLIVKDMTELECLIEDNIDKGYEGTIIRDLEAPHKNGRSTPTQGSLLRIKSFVEVDCIVEEVVEGQSNQNEATVNALGHTERSTHQANMVPNGMCGALICKLAEDALHPFTQEIIHRKGDHIRLAAGKMTHDERVEVWRNRAKYLGERCKGKIFPTGIKDKPRFPTWQAWRSEEDTIEK
jgi:DNA ligase-1